MSAVLILEVRAAGCRAGLSAGGKITWKRSASPRDLLALLVRSGRAFAAKKPAAVCVLSRQDATFSNARSSVSVANALAFAWRLPAFSLAADGSEKDAELSAKIAAAAKKKKAGAWAAPHYDAEPNITKPK